MIGKFISIEYMFLLYLGSAKIGNIEHLYCFSNVADIAEETVK